MLDKVTTQQFPWPLSDDQLYIAEKLALVGKLCSQASVCNRGSCTGQKQLREAAYQRYVGKLVVNSRGS